MVHFDYYVRKSMFFARVGLFVSWFVRLSVCLSVCLSACPSLGLLKQQRTDLHDTFTRGVSRAKDQYIKFWG